MEKEIRAIDSGVVELRKDEQGNEYIEGYAVVFNSPSRDLGGWDEVIMPEAFRNTDMTDVLGLFNHDRNLILGRTPNTMTLTVDAKGVRYSIKPPETTFADDLKKSIARGDIRGSSFGFSVTKDGAEWQKSKEKDGLMRRIVRSISKLWDVSPVAEPAYVTTDTSIAKRSLEMYRDAQERQDSAIIEQQQAERELFETKHKRELFKLKGALAYHQNFEDKLARLEQQEKDEREKEIQRMKREYNRYGNIND